MWNESKNVLRFQASALLVGKKKSTLFSSLIVVFLKWLSQEKLAQILGCEFLDVPAVSINLTYKEKRWGEKKKQNTLIKNQIF